MRQLLLSPTLFSRFAGYCLAFFGGKFISPGFAASKPAFAGRSVDLGSFAYTRGGLFSHFGDFRHYVMSELADITRGFGHIMRLAQPRKEGNYAENSK